MLTERSCPARLLAALPLILLQGPAMPDWTTPNDPAFRRFPEDPHQESLFRLNMPEAWKLEKGSRDLVIAVIDLAFDVTHPDLRSKLWTDPQNPEVHGWDFLDDDATLDGPQAEHGNHVAGIIAAETNNGIGIAGMAPNCPLMLVKVGLPGCLTDGDLQAKAIRYCVDKGARLICMNHGLSELYPGWHVPISGALKEACDDAYRKGVLIVTCTTSNDGAFYPATFPPAYDGVMGTGASDLWGRPSGMYGGSCFNEAIAPGGERTDGDHTKRSVYSCYAGDLQYNYYAGGCMATPHVVGLLALVLSHYPGIDVEVARQIVRNTAKWEREGHDVRWGHGLIQPVAALSLTPEQIAARPSLVPSSDVSPTDTRVVHVRNDGVLDARVRVSLWHGRRKVAKQDAVAVGFETTPVHAPAVADKSVSVRLENLGVARPRIHEEPPDIRLHITDDDLYLRPRRDGSEVLAVRVHNEGAVDAGRVVVIIHEHEPACAKRVGSPSRQLAAQVISVPAKGSAEAEFPTDQLPAADLWAEIENLEVGAPHVSREDGKAPLLGIPEMEGPDTRLPGRLETGEVRRVLRDGQEEVLRLVLAGKRECRVHVTVQEPEGGTVAAALRSPGEPEARPLRLRQGAWTGALVAGEHELRFCARKRTVYTFGITGPDDVWQRLLRATDRGPRRPTTETKGPAGPPPFAAWLATSSAAGALDLLNCQEGARLLLCPDGGAVQTIEQTGGVMGDSSVRSGGLGLWRRHPFAAGAEPTGAWLFVPSSLNAAGDFAIRGNFTIHWRCPDAETQAKLDGAPTMRLLQLRTRGAAATKRPRPTRYAEAIAAGLRFMEALTEQRPDGFRIHERWYIDDDAPRGYWGCDGQMLCARTYYQAFQRTGDTHFRDLALGIARRVTAHQNRDQDSTRFGAIPYGFVGPNEEVSWGTSSNIQGKILYGLAQLAAWSDDPELLEALRLNADYCVRIQYPSGRWPHHLEKAPESLCGYDAAWNVAGLLVAYEELHDLRYLEAAELALAAYARDSRPDGSIICPCSHATADEDDLAIRSSITMLTPYALALTLTGKPEYRRALEGLRRFLAAHQHASGVIKQPDNDCVNLIYAQNWGLQGLCEAFEATGDERFRDMALRLADFFVRAQLVSTDPHYDGAWVGSYNVAKDFPGGNMDDEGNAYDLYTSWGAGPIVYGLTRVVEALRPRP